MGRVLRVKIKKNRQKMCKYEFTQNFTSVPSQYLVYFSLEKNRPKLMLKRLNWLTIRRRWSHQKSIKFTMSSYLTHNNKFAVTMVRQGNWGIDFVIFFKDFFMKIYVKLTVYISGFGVSLRSIYTFLLKYLKYIYLCKNKFRKTKSQLQR